MCQCKLSILLLLCMGFLVFGHAKLQTEVFLVKLLMQLVTLI